MKTVKDISKKEKQVRKSCEEIKINLIPYLKEQNQIFNPERGDQ